MNIQNDNFFMRGVLVFVCLIAMVVALFLPCASVEATFYQQDNLVSDIPGLAAVTDPNLVNPWGIASSATSPFWIADNRTGLSTLYNGAGQPFPVGSPLVVTIPPPSGGTPPSAPTGVVSNPFSPAGNFASAPFIFAAEDGTISSWSGGTSAIRMVDNSPFGAIYTGLAISSTGNFLYAADFHNGRIDVFDTNYGSVTLPGSFTDPTLPSGYAPFNIQNINGNLYVTYAQQVAGAGNGIVDVYDANGNFIKRLITDGSLNSPWGMAIAPIGLFGDFSGALLVGNFGDGTINAFDPLTGNSLGPLLDGTGNPLIIEGLWGLKFGNGGNGGDTNALYFTAGIPGITGGNIEDHGLFGSISVQAVPEPATFLLLVAGVVGVGLMRRRFKK